MFLEILQTSQENTRNYSETVPFHKISIPGNYMKLRYFAQYMLLRFSKDNTNLSQSLQGFYELWKFWKWAPWWFIIIEIEPQFNEVILVSKFWKSNYQVIQARRGLTHFYKTSQFNIFMQIFILSSSIVKLKLLSLIFD